MSSHDGAQPRREAGPTATAPRVRTVIVNWNKRRETADCLRSLGQSRYPNDSVLVVDNGSTDGSEAALRREFPAVSVLQTGRNLGFAAAANLGIRSAMAEGDEFVWLLNNDTLVHPDALQRLVDAASESPSPAFVGSGIYYASDRERLWSLGATLEPCRGFATEHVGMETRPQARPQGIRRVDYAPCCSLLARTKAIERIGLMSESFFMYFEDADWCLRARTLGFDVVVCPASVVWHDWERDGKEHAPGYVRYLTRNRLWLCRRWQPRRLVSTLGRTVLVAGGLLTRSFRHRRSGAALLGILREFAAGVLQGLFGRIPPNAATGRPTPVRTAGEEGVLPDHDGDPSRGTRSS